MQSHSENTSDSHRRFYFLSFSRRTKCTKTSSFYYFCSNKMPFRNGGKSHSAPESCTKLLTCVIFKFEEMKLKSKIMSHSIFCANIRTIWNAFRFEFCFTELKIIRIKLEHEEEKGQREKKLLIFRQMVDVARTPIGMLIAMSISQFIHVSRSSADKTNSFHEEKQMKWKYKMKKKTNAIGRSQKLKEWKRKKCGSINAIMSKHVKFHRAYWISNRN